MLCKSRPLALTVKCACFLITGLHCLFTSHWEGIGAERPQELPLGRFLDSGVPGNLQEAVPSFRQEVTVAGAPWEPGDGEA